MIIEFKLLDLLQLPAQHPHAFSKISRITCNSNEATQGAVFFAIQGTTSDGHHYVSEAIERGAICVVQKSVCPGPRQIVVEDVRLAWSYACSIWFGLPSKKFNLIGICGTNGKTTTSYLFYEVWKILGHRSGLIGTIDIKMGDLSQTSQLTTPDAWHLQYYFSQMLLQKISDVAIEVSSIAVDQKRVASCFFKLGVFTNLTQDHLDYHGSMENYALAKQAFFKSENVSTVILNISDPFGFKLSQELTGKKIVTYGLDEGDYSASEIICSAKGSRFILKYKNKTQVFTSSLLGTHNVANSLAVIAGLHTLGVSLTSLSGAFEKVVGAPGRLERVDIAKNSAPSIYVDYAHTDDALKNVLSLLQELKKQMNGKIITVFGCGGDRDKSKRAKMARVAQSLSDRVVVTSDNPRGENPESILMDIDKGFDLSNKNYVYEVDRKKAIFLALTEATEKDIVLIAGKGHESYQIIGNEKHPFDDCDVVKSYYDNERLC